MGGSQSPIKTKSALLARFIAMFDQKLDPKVGLILWGWKERVGRVGILWWDPLDPTLKRCVTFWRPIWLCLEPHKSQAHMRESERASLLSGIPVRCTSLSLNAPISIIVLCPFFLFSNKGNSVIIDKYSFMRRWRRTTWRCSHLVL